MRKGAIPIMRDTRTPIVYYNSDSEFFRDITNPIVRGTSRYQEMRPDNLANERGQALAEIGALPISADNKRMIRSGIHISSHNI